MIIASNPLFCFRPFDEVIKKIEDGFEGWEFLAEAEHGWDHRETIQDTLSTSNLQIQVHAPFNDINISSLNRSMKKASIEEIRKAIDLCVMIGSEMLTVHPGLYSPMAREWSGTKDALLDSLITIKKLADDSGIMIALENMPACFPTTGITPEEIRYFTEKTGVGFCFDIGHANTTGRLDDFLEIDPVNIHIHDNHGEDDLHLPLGEGNIDFANVLSKSTNYEGNWVIEGRSLSELKMSKEYLIGLLS